MYEGAHLLNARSFSVLLGRPLKIARTIWNWNSQNNVPINTFTPVATSIAAVGPAVGPRECASDDAKRPRVRLAEDKPAPRAREIRSSR
jgi:hypothetical protein